MIENYSVEYHFDLISKLVVDIRKVRTYLKISNKKSITAQFKSDLFYLYLIFEGMHILEYMCNLSNIELTQDVVDSKDKVILTLGPVSCYLSTN